MHYLLEATQALIAFWGVRFPMLSEGECWFLAMLTVLLPVYLLNVLVYRPRAKKACIDCGTACNGCLV